MYQTRISAVNGTTAIDTAGRMLKIAGSAPVVPGKIVWTDGVVIYGSIPSGGGNPVILCYELVTIDSDLNLYAIRGAALRFLGKAQNIMLGSMTRDKYAVWRDNEGYFENGRLVAGRNTICAGYSPAGDVISLEADPDEHLTLYYDNSSSGAGKIERCRLKCSKAAWNDSSRQYGSTYAEGWYYVYQDMILHLHVNGVMTGNITINYERDFGDLWEDTKLAGERVALAAKPEYALGDLKWYRPFVLELGEANIKKQKTIGENICLLIYIRNKAEGATRYLSSKWHYTYYYIEDEFFAAYPDLFDYDTGDYVYESLEPLRQAWKEYLKSDRPVRTYPGILSDADINPPLRRCGFCILQYEDGAGIEESAYIFWLQEQNWSRYTPGDISERESFMYGTINVQVNDGFWMRCEYDMQGNLLSKRQILRRRHTEYINNKEPHDIWETKYEPNWREEIDGFDVEYRLIEEPDKNGGLDKSWYIPYKASVTLGNTTWVSDNGDIVYSIKQYRGKYYIVHRFGITVVIGKNVATLQTRPMYDTKQKERFYVPSVYLPAMSGGISLVRTVGKLRG